MSRIARWLKERRQTRMIRYMAKVRIGSQQEKEAFLGKCIKDAYGTLYFAMVTLEAPRFVEGTIQEQTTGEWFHIELRKIEEPLNDLK